MRKKKSDTRMKRRKKRNKATAAHTPRSRCSRGVSTDEMEENENPKSQSTPTELVAEDSSPSRLAFVGSGPGPLPRTSIALASFHLPSTAFHNYDLDPSATASRLISCHPDLSNRFFFHTADIMEVTRGLTEYKVVFLGALVGMDVEEKSPG